MRTKFLLFLIVIFISSSLINGQETDSEESSIVSVPENAMQEIVPRILIYNFKPLKKKKVIFLGQKGIKQDWLPKINNVEFRLLTEEEIEDKGIDVYFFTESEKQNRTYEIGFAYGNPGCDYSGRNSWKFRISKNKVRLWTLNSQYGFGGGCGVGGTFSEFENPGQINEFPNELEGYKFFDVGKLKGLKLTISAKKDVINNLGEECESSCVYDDKWKVRFRYFGDYSIEKTVDDERIKFVAKPGLVGKLYEISLIPKSTLLFDKVVFPPPFKRSRINSIGHDFEGGSTHSSYIVYKERYGLEYTTLDEISYTTDKNLKWQKGELTSIAYTIPKKRKEEMFVEQQQP